MQAENLQTCLIRLIENGIYFDCFKKNIAPTSTASF